MSKTTYASDCSLCAAAAAANSVEGDPDLKTIAKEHGVTERLLKQRLGMKVNARTNWDEDKIAEVQKMLDDGMSLPEIGEHYGVGASRMYQLVRRYEKQLDTESGKDERQRRKIRQATERSENILAVLNDKPNLTPEEIASKLDDGTSVAQVTRILRGMGVPVKESGSSKSDKDDTVKVPKKTDKDEMLKIISDYIGYCQQEGEPVSLENYLQWAPEGAPRSKDILGTFGSWSKAKAAASEAFAVS